MLLAIDTATRIAGIALYDQDGLHAEYMWQTSDNHTVELMPYIVRACEQQTLAPSALTAVAVSLGPGSFTGLRVGMSVAKGLALALNIPLLGIPTLDATAYAHSHQPLPVCAVLPAGRGRWCTAFYQVVAGTWRRRSEYALATLDALSDLLKEPTLVCGEMDQRLIQALREAVPGHAIIASPAFAIRRAGYLAELAWQRFAAGERDNLSSLSPIYLQHA
ncbi:MAG: tRNA (adenosine(37)-N6)-threonylcarbamoyltransferase complex dimerization subunit type 1 TsaB [Chloroflexi bacterium]|nr:tRNA (adenosine(37)-N6)-threonylcarbamoyltransferase complex dimerization subunit type 1 TsaB [Chloroflexota bacterium]